MVAEWYGESGEFSWEYVLVFMGLDLVVVVKGRLMSATTLTSEEEIAEGACCCTTALV